MSTRATKKKNTVNSAANVNTPVAPELQDFIPQLKKFKKEKKTHLRLTAKGKSYILKHRNAVLRSPPTWDNKWRLVIFDIPEEKGKLRRLFRSYLITLGFGKVQRSAWISPHDFSNVVQRYADKLKLSSYIFQITADSFQGLSADRLNLCV
ncbi:MAG: CRISPR-associated endonuclease Cas2 [PVC group bacterium]